MTDNDLSHQLKEFALGHSSTTSAVSQTAILTDVTAGSRELPIIYLAIGSLTPNPRNARKHPKKQIEKLAASLREFGFIGPLIVDENNIVLVGHGRLEAAKLLGLEQVPVIRVCHLTEAQKRAFTLADNRLAEDAVWDLEKLAIEFKELADLNIDFIIENTGFETVEIDQILEKDEVARAAAAQESVPEPDPKQPPVTRQGDLWRLGDHLILCGDATVPENYARLMGDERAQMVITDAPFNLKISSIVGSGSIQHAEFPMASGEMTSAEFTAFLRSIVKLLVLFSIDGSIHFLFMDWRHISELLHAADGVYAEYKNLCIWAKDNAGLGSFYRAGHELVFAFKSGTAPHINNFGLGGDGRYRTNVWRYPGVNVRRPGGRSDLKMHPTAKPVALVMDAMKDCSRRKGIILDLFSGSGTTIIACQRTRRIARVMELDPAYVDLAILRWEALTGETAWHAEFGGTLDEVAAERGIPSPHFSFERK